MTLPGRETDAAAEPPEMSVSSLPRLFGPAPGAGRIKALAEDFQVEEILGFEPSDEGEHCFLWVEKIGHNSNDVAGHFADRLGIRKRLVSHSGLKDRQALTRQWFSIHLPGAVSPTPADLETAGVRILRVTRNRRKLRRGTHIANRFLIRVRGFEGAPSDLENRWSAIAARGVPNYFGGQRFGREAGNLEQARRLFREEIEVRDRLLRGILLSSARSALFNAVVAERLRRDLWETVLPGEVFGFPDNRSLVLPHNLRGDESERVALGALECSAPLWGEGELSSRDVVRELEETVAATHGEIARGLARFGLRQERRVIRLRPVGPDLFWRQGDPILRFDLPKGTYATTVLRELVDTLPEARG